MRAWLRNRDRAARGAAAAALLIGVLAGAQEPAAPAPTPAPPAAAPAAAPAPKAGIVTANILVVRARPATHYERIGQFARGDRVSIVSSTADWLEVTVPPDTRAWIAAQYLKPDGTAAADQVRLHCGPGLVFTHFATVRQGTRLELLGPPVDGWQQVRAPADATGWVNRAYVRVTDTEPAPAAEQTGAGAAAAAGAETGPAAPPAQAEPAAAQTPAAQEPAAAQAPAAQEPAPAQTTAPAEPAAQTPAAQEPAAAQAPAQAEPAAAAAQAGPEAPPVEPVAPIVETDTSAEAAAGKAGEAPAATETAPSEPAAGLVLPEPVVLAPAPDAPTIMKEGILLSLRSQASEIATHVLCMRVEGTVYPVCYLKSSRLDLSEWENRNVRVYGPEVRVPGWNLPVLHVHSIQVELK